MGPSIVAGALGSTTGGPTTPELLFGVIGIVLVGVCILALWRSSRRRVDRVVSGVGGRSEFDRETEALIYAGAPQVAVLAVVVDGLDEVAELHGQTAAEALVGQAGKLLTRRLRSSDTAYHLADDELLALLNGADEAAARRVAERVLGGIEVLVSPTGHLVTAAAGIAAGPAVAIDSNVAGARRAATVARSSGRNRIATA